MSNLLGVFISPVTTSLLFSSSGASFKLDIVSLLIELLTIIALPMVIGYVLTIRSPSILVRTALHSGGRALCQEVLVYAEDLLLSLPLSRALGEDERLLRQAQNHVHHGSHLLAPRHHRRALPVASASPVDS